ncbi:MAG: dihydrodipicolinate synthase family protein [Paracoccaceae bacterium]|nr:dihydrodipicolinate synthase family protein [Paracoccaceae bacterium]
MDPWTQPLRGIFPVLPTPFTDAGAVDTNAMTRIVDFALGTGVDGVVYPGFASEVSELTDAERAELLEIVVARAGDRTRIIAGASGSSATDTIRHGRRAVAFGVNLLMIQPPGGLGRDLERLIRYFSEVTDAIPEARFVLQNAPAPRGSDLTPETICRLAVRFPQIAYVKEETLPAGPAISHVLAHRPASLGGVFGGGGARYILDEYSRGACAAAPALEIADLHVALDRAWRNGRPGDARDIYVRTLPLLVLQAVYRMRLTKHVLMRRGVLEWTGVRAPTPELDTSAIADIDANLAELGLVRPTADRTESAA